MNLGVYTSAQYNDDVNYAEKGALADEVIGMGVDAGFMWPATPQSSVYLDAGVGYLKYLEHSQYDRLELSPNSVLNWDVAIKDVKMSFFDQFSYDQQVVSEPSLAGVAISGAQALVAGVVTHPSGLVCIRTDVGGAYRWDRPNSRWIALNDSFAFTNRDCFGCESLAIDPNNANVFYYAGGQGRLGDANPGAILKSTNGGGAWSKLAFSATIAIDGNADRRWAGERLAVDPANSQNVLFGSRQNGLWRSINGGTNWTQVASIPTASDYYGVQSVEFDPLNPGTVYAAVSGFGVYQSVNHGATFASIGGATSPRRLKVAPNGTLWHTHGAGVGKYAGGIWTTYTPGSTASDIYCGLAVNPSNSLDILVGRSECFTGSEKIYRTTNGGTNWTQLNNSYSSPVPWFSNWGSMWTCNLAFDPLNTNVAWCAQWRTANLNMNPSWVIQETGHEEDCVTALLAPPSGPYELLTGSWDDDGFALTNLNVYPGKTLGVGNNYANNTWGMAYQRTAPRNMLRIAADNYNGGAGLNLAKSTDGGATWSRLNNFPTTNFPVQCAISATDSNKMVVIGSSLYSTDPTGNTWPGSYTNTSPWLYSANGGTTWLPITGLPAPPRYTGQPWPAIDLAADGADGNKFYYYDYSSSTGKLYVSSDGGHTFPEVHGAPPGSTWISWWQLKACPNVAGDLWLSLDCDSPTWESSTRYPLTEGIYHSTNGGTNWTKLGTVGRTWAFGFGLPTAVGGPATIFMYGRTHGTTQDSLYRSADFGQSWVNILSPTNQLSDFPSVVEGSWQTVGRVFVGTGGRGVFYGTDCSTELTSLGAQTSGYAFTITGVSNLSVIVETCTNLTAGAWQPIGTNPMTSSPFYFTDPKWTNSPLRFYRVSASPR